MSKGKHRKKPVKVHGFIFRLAQIGVMLACFGSIVPIVMTVVHK